MSQHNFDRLLQKYLLGECSPQEEVMVLKWYQHLIEKSNLEISDGEKKMIQAKIWSNLSSGISIEQVPAVNLNKGSISLAIVYRLAVAASIILCVSIGWYFWSAHNSKSLAAGKSTIGSNDISFTNNSKTEQAITLTDGSIVTLQPKSTLKYPRVFSGSLREVYLEGDAFFSVFRNPAQHFKVHMGGLVTEVLGTSFRIHQDPSANKFEIAVVTGKVSVYQKDKKMNSEGGENQAGTVILTTNQMVTFNTINSQFITSLVKEPQVVSQYNKTDTSKFIFDDAPLSRVLEELKKAYGIEISTESDDIGNCHFTGDITKQGLYKKLEIICQSFPMASFEVEGTTIILKGKGCK